MNQKLLEQVRQIDRIINQKQEVNRLHNYWLESVDCGEIEKIDLQVMFSDNVLIVMALREMKVQLEMEIQDMKS